MNSLETQTQQTSQMDQEGVEQCSSHHVSIDAMSQVRRYRDESHTRSRQAHDVETDRMVYASFNLQNINVPVPPKWKHNEHILEEYKKFHHSSQHIFDGPMAHVMNDKVKTNMFLI